MDPADDPWISFFQYLVSGSAAILGLAFLTFQVRSDIWRSHPLRVPVALTTLTELAAPVFFGLIFLMPSHPWTLAGVIVGVGGYLVIAYHALTFFRCTGTKTSFDRIQMWGITVPLITFGCLLAIPNLTIKASICVWMIFSGLSEAWIFLRPPSDDVGSIH